ncbi:hypothetical protein C8R46DRAFT_1114249 [Mycena filopes]|nr:hypothetical protein C8R46DRAFT_1114249 [Mycena filopes]
MALELPVELLRQIFAMSVPTREEAIELGRMSFVDSPWCLTLVSHQWRVIALSMPSLWSSITIAIEPSTPAWTNYPLGLARAQIVRSGTSPLQVFFISKEVPGHHSQKLFAAIVPSCNRWQTLQLDSVWPLPHIVSIRDRIPLLQEVFVCIDNPLGSAFRSAPRLRVARIVNPRAPEGSQRAEILEIILPWPQLSIFETSYDDRRQFDGFLLAPNLVECQIVVYHPMATPFGLWVPLPPPWHPPPQPVVFPNLTKLTLDAPGIHLDALVLPALEALVIRTFSSEFDRVVHMLTRSGCSLRKFWMKARPPLEQFLQVLSHNPAIFEIGIPAGSIDGHTSIAQVLGALTLRSGGQPVYAPALTRFIIKDTGPNLDDILAMAESRFNLAHLHGCSRLQALVIFDGGYPFYRGRIPPRIAALRAAGLEVEIRMDESEEARSVLRGRLHRYI